MVKLKKPIKNCKRWHLIENSQYHAQGYRMESMIPTSPLHDYYRVICYDEKTLFFQLRKGFFESVIVGKFLF